MKARSGFRSGAEASRKSKKPFTGWREEPIRCEGCGEERSYYDFIGDNEFCNYCVFNQPLGVEAYRVKQKGGDRMGLKEWASKEKSRVEEERKKSFPPSWKPPIGTSTVQILDDEVRDISGQYGPAKVFSVKVKGTKQSWIINEKSPVLRQLITMISQGVMRLRVIRTGTKMATRYQLEKA